MVRMRKLLIVCTVLSCLYGAGCGAVMLSADDAQDKGKIKGIVNPEAAQLMLRGATAEALKDYQTALAYYQEASLHEPNSPGIQRALGENYLRLGRIESGLICLKKAAELDPENVEIHLILADAYSELRRFAEAEVEYRALFELDRNDTESLGRLITVMLTQKKVAEAFKEYKKAQPSLVKDSELHFRLGNLFLRSGAYDESIEVYESIYKGHPEDENAYLALAAATIGKQDTSRAIEWYRRALAENPDFEDAKAELRNLYVARKRFDEALALYQELIERDPADLNDWLELGRLHIQKGDTLAAVEVFAKTIAQFPDRERPYLLYGLTKEAVADTIAAIEGYRTALTINLGFNRVRESLRNLYIQRREWQKAIELYEVMIGKDSADVQSSLELVNLHYLRGDTALALSMVGELEGRFPEDWRIPYTGGRVEYLRAQWREAEKYLRRTLNAYDRRSDTIDRRSEIWELLGRTLLFQNNLEAAEAEFRRAVEVYPEHEALNFYLASTLNQKGKSSEALPFILTSLEKNPDYVPSLLVLAACYADLEHYDKSDEVYENILSLAPDNAMALNNYSYSLAQRSIRLDEALHMVEQALEEEPENGSYLDTIGWVYYQIGDYEMALKYITKSVEVRDSSAEVWEHLGNVYEKLEDLDRARKYWQKALDLDKNRSYLEEKLK